jgi:hypothetical protein
MAGRPSMYTTAGEIDAEIQEYFAKDGKKTITGLAYHLGFESRQSFYDYEKDGEFSYTLKRARLKVEMGYEEGLHESACAGSIFALKNFGWRDKVETGFTDSDGKDVKPQLIFQPAPNCQPIAPEFPADRIEPTA